MKYSLPRDPIDRLCAIGRIIYDGGPWQKPLAKLLGVDRKTLYRWQTLGSPDDLDARLAKACRDHGDFLDDHTAALRKLAEKLDGGGK